MAQWTLLFSSTFGNTILISDIVVLTTKPNEDTYKI